MTKQLEKYNFTSSNKLRSIKKQRNSNGCPGRREQPLGEERLAVLREMLEADEEQQERSLQLAFDDAVRARELEAALRREQNAETAAFHQSCLGTLSQLVQVLSGQRDRFLHPRTRPSSSIPRLDPVPPSLD